MKKKNNQSNGSKSKLTLSKMTIQKLQFNNLMGLRAGSGDPRCDSHNDLCGSSKPKCTCPTATQ
jgi:hypothetical protein